MFGLEAGGVWGVWGEAYVVDKVILRRSIMSCSFVVLTGAGGSGKANALLGTEVEAEEIDEVDDGPSGEEVPLL